MDLNIDYDLLNKQVKDLLTIRYQSDKNLTPKQQNSLDGIIELIEAIQDNKLNKEKDNQSDHIIKPQ